MAWDCDMPTREHVALAGGSRARADPLFVSFRSPKGRVSIAAHAMSRSRATAKLTRSAFFFFPSDLFLHCQNPARQTGNGARVHD